MANMVNYCLECSRWACNQQFILERGFRGSGFDLIEIISRLFVPVQGSSLEAVSLDQLGLRLTAKRPTDLDQFATCSHWISQFEGHFECVCVERLPLTKL